MKTKSILFLIALALVSRGFAQIPLLNSNANITDKVIFLDFDGHNCSGTLWNSGNLITAAASSMSSNNINLIFKRMREDFRPFDVNLTTDSVRFNSALPNKRIRVVVTPTSAWYTTPAGGVAYVGSFAWGGTPGTPCWVFENQLGYSTKNIAEAASHEVGHTLTLKHQSTYSMPTCSKTAEYNPGVGSGVTSWAPIMGVGYSKNITVWSFGTNATTCTTIQYDHGSTSPGITSSGYLNYITDDVGGTYATGKLLNLNSLNVSDSGMITQPTDVDVYKFTICNNRYVSFNVKPWALDTLANSYLGADLDIRFALYNSSNTLLAIDTTLTRLNTLVGVNLSPGSYYFTIDGGRSSNYTDYGSLGQYFIDIKATNPPQLTNTIVVNPVLCAGQNAVLSYSSNGVPTSWQWTVSGPVTGSYNIASPSFVFASAGIYTVNLLATSAASLSCPTSLTLNVGIPPATTISNPHGLFCAPNNSVAVLIAGGAASYLWMPGAYTGATLNVIPAATTVYTLTGSNGACTSSVVTTLSVNPAFTTSVAVSSASLCYGGSATLTASGANSYVFNPPGSTLSALVVTPLVNTNYTISGNVNGCVNKKVVSIVVNPDFSPGVTASADTICEGQTVIFSGAGTPIFTVNPGGITGNPAILSPSVTTSFTLITSNNGTCVKDTVITVATKTCSTEGLSEEMIASAIRIYPNPAFSQVMIDTPGNIEKIEVLNMVGELVFAVEIKNAPAIVINTQDWSRGIYLVKLRSVAGNQLDRKLVLE